MQNYVNILTKKSLTLKISENLRPEPIEIQPPAPHTHVIGRDSWASARPGRDFAQLATTDSARFGACGQDRIHGLATLVIQRQHLEEDLLQGGLAPARAQRRDEAFDVGAC